MNNNDDINKYLPSILNPRGVRKQDADLSLTQNSIISRCSLSLKRKISNANKFIQKACGNNKENVQNNNKVTFESPNVIKVTKKLENRSQLSCTQTQPVVLLSDKKITQNLRNTENCISRNEDVEQNSVGLSTIEDVDIDKANQKINKTPTVAPPQRQISSQFSSFEYEPVQNYNEVKDDTLTLRALSSATDLNHEHLTNTSISTIELKVQERPVLSVSFGIINCQSMNLSTKNSNIKNLVISHKDNDMNVDCDVEEASHISISDDDDDDKVPKKDDDDDDGPTPAKRSAVAVNLEIKTKKSTVTATENSKVLILNTNAIERLSHVIIQPPNYKLVKRQISDVKFKNNSKWKLESVRNGKNLCCDNLKQKRIDCYFGKNALVSKVSPGTLVESVENAVVACNDNEDMSRNLGVAAESAKYDRSAHRTPKSVRREVSGSPRPKLRNAESPKPPSIRNTTSEGPRCQSKARNNSASSSPSPRKNVDSIHFSLPSKGMNKTTSLVPKAIPYYKIVAGTHFAVDAFSYGDIPNVKHYFLTHFHSDHYSGLKKGFNKFLFCTKITADLCVSRLGVSPKCIHIVNFDETFTVDGVEVTAVDANHCPGAMMLVFTLPNGKTILHTGDFRASPNMESYPIFWNKDIHTIYLDSTYCNPRYDFPTQDQSLEMALYLLRQKKMSLEKSGKKFSSVLIVCGTYTIGKEKFFLGLARRVGCSVWACPEKDKVLQAVEGRSFGSSAPTACQLHVVPMRDLTHEKLHNYMESLHGAFTEVVAFKPSGWENGKNSTVEKDQVTIHGIPYSEHSSFSEMIRFVKYLKPKQVVPTVDISGGVKAVQKYFPCPLVCKDMQSQSKVTDYFSIQTRQQVPAVT